MESMGSKKPRRRRSFTAEFRAEKSEPSIRSRGAVRRAGARRAIVEYIGRFNGTRLHSAPGYLSPAEFRDHNR
jgi:transposase InsO family protein